MTKSNFVVGKRIVYSIFSTLLIYMMLCTMTFPMLADGGHFGETGGSTETSGEYPETTGDENNADTGVIYDGEDQIGELGRSAAEGTMQSGNAMAGTIIAVAIIAAIIIAIIIMIPGKSKK